MFGRNVVELGFGPEEASLERLRAALAVFAAAEAELLSALGAVDAVGLCDIEDGLQTVQWLSRNGACSTVTARKRVRAARAVRDRLDVDTLDRVRDGQIGLDHIAVLDRLSNPRIEPEWSLGSQERFDAASLTTFDRWSKEMAGLAELLDQDGGYDPSKDELACRLRVGGGADELILSGFFVGERAEIIRQALAAETDRLWRQAQRDEVALGVPVPDRATLMAFALAELCRSGRIAGGDGTVVPGATELEFIVRGGAGGSGGAGDVQLVSPSGELLDVRSFGRALCDPAIVAIITDAAGSPVAVGNRARLASKQQRRMLAERDGGCVMPGCDRPAAWTDAHHIVAFHVGGCTDLNNLALLCRHHHGVVHRKGWKMRLDADGWCWFTKPDGERMWGQRHGRQREGPLPP